MSWTLLACVHATYAETIVDSFCHTMTYQQAERCVLVQQHCHITMYQLAICEAATIL